MATNIELQRRIEAFVESLEAEFRPVAQGKHNCLFSAIEDFGVQVGDEVTKTMAGIASRLRWSNDVCYR